MQYTESPLTGIDCYFFVYLTSDTLDTLNDLEKTTVTFEEHISICQYTGVFGDKPRMDWNYVNLHNCLYNEYSHK